MSACPVQHNLKLLQPYYRQVMDGQKTWELRKNDRDFQVGDWLNLHEHLPGETRSTGRVLHMIILGVHGPAEHIQIPEGYVLLSMKFKDPWQTPRPPR